MVEPPAAAIIGPLVLLAPLDAIAQAATEMPMESVIEIPAAFYWPLWISAFAVILWFMLRFFGPKENR